ncbi:MAG: PAS domain-containing protein [Verrucomicrobiales bacterium]|nr:PAS domain-containing protein [Verrucomicrobiales bacterium]
MIWQGSYLRQALPSNAWPPLAGLALTHLLLAIAGGFALRHRLHSPPAAATEIPGAKDRFRQALDAAPFPAMLHSEAGQVVMVNRVWTEITGYSLADIPTTASWMERAYGSGMHAVRASIQELYHLKTRKSEGEFEVRTRSGDTRTWDFSSVALGEIPGAGRLVLSMAVDVTERKRVEADLRRSEANLRWAQSIGQIGNWISPQSKEGRLEWSPECCRIFGRTPDQFDGRIETFWAHVHPEDREAVKAASEAAFNGSHAYDLEHRIVRPDGSVRWVHEQAEVERDEHGQPRRMMGVVQDITTRRQLEDQLRQAQKMEAVGQLAGGIAHDFNNILAIMLLQISLQQQRTNLDPDLQQAFADLESCARRAAELTRQLLVFGHRAPPSFQSLHLPKLIAGIDRMLRRVLGEHITPTFEIDPNLPCIQADAGMIQQVILNLCFNARDAMPQGGRLTLKAHQVAGPIEGARLHPGARPGHYLCLTVADTGCGMDAATVSRIFEPFFTTKEVGKGTGLGLAMVHGIVTQHGGWLEVESTVGVGSTFRVLLPVREANAAAPPESPQPVPSGKGQTVLLVEDEPGLRSTVTELLRRWGWQVLEAADGPEAVTLWNQHQNSIDLLFSDMIMPGGLTGLDLARRFRAHRPDLRILISSGHTADLARPEDITRVGAVFLRKPYPPERLAKSIAEALETPSAPLPDP